MNRKKTRSELEQDWEKENKTVKNAEVRANKAWKRIEEFDTMEAIRAMKVVKIKK
jgi:hypothetical protein